MSWLCNLLPNGTHVETVAAVRATPSDRLAALARTIIERYPAVAEGDDVLPGLLEAAIEDALRLTWRARGAEDLRTMRLGLASIVGDHTADLYMIHVERAIQALNPDADLQAKDPTIPEARATALAGRATIALREMMLILGPKEALDILRGSLQLFREDLTHDERLRHRRDEVLETLTGAAKLMDDAAVALHDPACTPPGGPAST